MKKMFVLGICLVLVSSVHGQFQFYKVENGTKALLKGGEEVVIDIDENLKPNRNVMVEVNVAEFKKKYTYNLFAVTLMQMLPGDDNMLMRYPIFFGSEYYTSKFGTDKTIRFYLFPDASPTKDLKACVFYQGDDWYNKFKYENTLDTLLFELEGRYKTGSEVYYDESSGSVKDRDLFTDPEYHTLETPQIRFTAAEKLKAEYQRKLDEQRYQEVIADPGLSTYYRQGKINYITLYGILEPLNEEISKVRSYNIGGTGGVILYPQIATAIQEIAAYRTKQVQDEPDMYKAFTMLNEWETDSKKLMIIERLTEDQRKQLNKQLKSAPDAAAKYQLFLAFQ